MKKITRIEIGGRKFYFEENALEALENYTTRIKELYRDNGEELKVADIECRIADICEKQTGEKGIVNITTIKEAIESIGIEVETLQDEQQQTEESEPSTEEKRDESDEPWYRAMLLGRKLFRSPHDGYIAGVLSGFAAYYGTSTALLRILTVLLAIIEPVGGIVFLAYIALWIILPKATSIIDYTRLRRASTKIAWKKNYERTMQELATTPASGCLPTLVKVLFYAMIAIMMIPVGAFLLAIIVIPICFLGLLFSGNITSLIVLPHIFMLISIVVAVVIIIFAVVHWILKKFNVCKPMKPWAKGTLVVLLIVSFILTGITIYRTAAVYGGLNYLKQIITNELYNITSLVKGTRSNLSIGNYSSYLGTFYRTNPVDDPADKLFASLWKSYDSGLPFAIETIHNNCGEYRIHFYSQADEERIAQKNSDACYTIECQIIHGALYFVYDKESNTIYTDEQYRIPQGTRHSRLTRNTEALNIGSIGNESGFNFGNATEKGLQTFAIFYYGNSRTPSLLVGGSDTDEGVKIAPHSTYKRYIKGASSPVRATTINGCRQKDTVTLNTSIAIDHDKIKQTMSDVKQMLQKTDSIVKNAQGIVDIDYTVTE